MVWYGSVRLVLETFRDGWNWTLAGIPTAMLVGVVLIVVGIATAWWRHRGPAPASGRSVPAGPVPDGGSQRR
jgi:prolipoprotein diacylglyceryltransferase